MPISGKVKWFDPKKGFGFIVGPEGQDVFVHFSQIQSEGFRSLKDGEEVEYELVEGEKGFQARDVMRTGASTSSPSPSSSAPSAPSAPTTPPASASRGYSRGNFQRPPNE